MLRGHLAASTPHGNPNDLMPMRVHELNPLFHDVQIARVFRDDKTFVDSRPRRPFSEINAAYALLNLGKPDRARLLQFVEENFTLPVDPDVSAKIAMNLDVREQISVLWQALRREPDEPSAGSTLLPLPKPYIVPGGRFREVYYWDSFFTMLGLRDSGEGEMVDHMVANLLHLIGKHGLIPNGNRSYYLSRSQPPVLALIAELVTSDQPAVAITRFRDAMQMELDYWMDRSAPTRHVVEMPDGSRLNRYWDQLDTPRPESYSHDEDLAMMSGRSRTELFRDIRSAAESGWDFSSRWLGDGQSLETIRTTQLIPVDLNCFLWQLETTLARAHAVYGDEESFAKLERAAARRQQAIQRYCWSPDAGFYCDYDIVARRPNLQPTIAGVTPLYFGLATKDQAAAVARKVSQSFLSPGGVVTTLRETGQQWDAPNGWAPLQWLTIRGLSRYAHTDLASEIARRWIQLNISTFADTGFFLEKYNVIETHRAPGGGEYDSQHGFGWTNGVLLRLLKEYPLK